MGAVLVLAVLALAVGTSKAQPCRFASFAPLLADQPTLTIVAQIVRTLESANSPAVPVPADGVTFLAPTDAAFISLLSTSGLTTAVAQRTLAAKGVSILLYHLLDGGAYTPAQLLDLAAAQSNLGRSLDAPLPLTFEANPSGAVVASGVTNEGTLSAATPVCTSSLYVIDSVLLPSRTLATVPSATAADAAPATAPALAPALGPAVAIAAGPEGEAIAAAGPGATPVAVSGPGIAPAVGVLAPLAAPDSAPAPSVALEPANGPSPASTAAAPEPSSAAIPAFGALAPAAGATADQSAAGAGASLLVLACALTGSLLLLAGSGML